MARTFTYDGERVQVSRGPTYWHRYTGEQTRVGPDGTQTIRQLDAAGRVESFVRRRADTGTTLRQAEYSYYANGQLRRVDYANNAAIEYTYDAAGRITAISHLDAAGDIMLRLSYEYNPHDVRGLPTVITEEVDTGIRAETRFYYDGLGRLAREKRTPGDKINPWYDLRYTYDLGGNRLTAVDEANDVETVYHYDVEDEAQYVYGSANNRLMYFETFDTRGADLLVSTTYYYYNNYGNITRKVTQLANPEPGEKEYHATHLKYATNGQAVTYVLGEEWDWNGYPGSEVTNYAVTFAREFWYDGARQRFLNREFDPVELTGDNMVVLSETWSDYAGDNIYADFTLNGSTLTVPRIYEPGIGKVEDPFGVLDRAHSHTDHIGTTRLLSDNEGLSKDESLYTAFGSLVSGTNHRYGYAGKHGYQSHADTPFLHVGARYYDPDTGRFLQRDPIGIMGGVNVYEYCSSNPVASIDPSGTWNHGTHQGNAQYKSWREQGHSPSSASRQMERMAPDEFKTGLMVGVGLGTAMAAWYAAPYVASAAAATPGVVASGARAAGPAIACGARAAWPYVRRAGASAGGKFWDGYWGTLGKAAALGTAGWLISKLL